MTYFRQYASFRTAVAGIVFAISFAVAAAGQTAQAPGPAVQPPSLRILFAEGVSTEDVWLAYGLYTPGLISSYIGLQGPSAKTDLLPTPPRDGQGHLVSRKNSPPFYEIDGVVNGKAIERFQALVWSPGCKMTFFDVPHVTGNVEEHLICSALNDLTLTGKVRGIDLAGKAATLWVGYYAAMATCFLLHTCDNGRPISCADNFPTIAKIASAPITTDGSFKIDVPDFSTDPLASRGGLVFSVGDGRRWLEPEREDLRSFHTMGVLKILQSYPGDLILVPNDKWR